MVGPVHSPPAADLLSPPWLERRGIRCCRSRGPLVLSRGEGMLVLGSSLCDDEDGDEDADAVTGAGADVDANADSVAAAATDDDAEDDDDQDTIGVNISMRI